MSWQKVPLSQWLQELQVSSDPLQFPDVFLAESLFAASKLLESLLGRACQTIEKRFHYLPGVEHQIAWNTASFQDPCYS